jgi:hypothetical protein
MMGDKIPETCWVYYNKNIKINKCIKLDYITPQTASYIKLLVLFSIKRLALCMRMEILYCNLIRGFQIFNQKWNDVSQNVRR